MDNHKNRVYPCSIHNLHGNHKSPKDLVCIHCKKIYSRTDTLARHIKTIHSGKVIIDNNMQRAEIINGDTTIDISGNHNVTNNTITNNTITNNMMNIKIYIPSH